MKVTVQQKVPSTVTVTQIENTTNAIATGQIEIGIEALNNVDTTGAQQGDMLVLVGTKWEAKPLDGGTFN